MTKKSRYLEQLQRRKDATKSVATPPAKPVEQMTDAELQQELESARAAARAADEKAVLAAREPLGGGQSGRLWFPRKAKRASWK